MKERNPCPKLPSSLELEVKRELNEIAAELLQQVNSATAGQSGTASSRELLGLAGRHVIKAEYRTWRGFLGQVPNNPVRS